MVVFDLVIWGRGLSDVNFDDGWSRPLRVRSYMGPDECRSAREAAATPYPATRT